MTTNLVNADSPDEYDDDVYRLSPSHEKREYLKIFHSFGFGSYSSTRGSYYSLGLLSVQVIVGRILEGKPPLDYEGPAALYLFRHYLELALKNIVGGVRCLDSKDKNSTTALPVPGTHYLVDLWREAKDKIPQKLGPGILRQWDYRFVEKCIEEFHSIDLDSERLRYGSLQAQGPDAAPTIQVDWSALLMVMQHTHDVLEDIHTYLVETYGRNEDFESEQNSW
jgi:hypothetical protein